MKRIILKKVFKYSIRRYLDINTFFFISNNISTPRRLFCKPMRTSTLFLFYYGNKIQLIVFLYRRTKQTSFLYNPAEKAVLCCTFVILRIQTIGFLFEKKQVSFNKSLFYILIELSAINTIAYLFLLTKCFNGGRLICQRFT